MATSEDIKDAAATAAAAGISSASTDGKSVSAIDPLRQLEIADKIAANEAIAASTDGRLLSRVLGTRLRGRPPGAT